MNKKKAEEKKKINEKTHYDFLACFVTFSKTSEYVK